MRSLDDIVCALIRERQANPAAPSPHGFEDLLGTLLKVRYEDGTAMPAQQVRDEVMTLLLAGHETTAVSRSPDRGFCCTTSRGGADSSGLSSMPSSEAAAPRRARSRQPALHRARRARSHARLSAGLGHRAYRDQAGRNRRLPHPREISRHHEPMGDAPRRASTTSRIASIPIAGSTSATGPPRASPTFFGGGPRICIGASFAQTEAVLVLATIAQRYQVRVDSTTPIQPTPSITLRPRHGIPATLTRRSDAAPTGN